MIPTSKFINDLKRAGGMTKVKLRRLKGIKWKYPLSLERQYAAAINRFMSKRWKEYAKIAVPMMVPRVDALEDLEPEEMSHIVGICQRQQGPVSENAFRDCMNIILAQSQSAAVASDDDLLALRNQLKERKGTRA